MDKNGKDAAKGVKLDSAVCDQRKEERKRGRGMFMGLKKTVELKRVKTNEEDKISVDLELASEEWRVISVYNRAGKKAYLERIEGEIDKTGRAK